MLLHKKTYTLRAEKETDDRKVIFGSRPMSCVMFSSALTHIHSLDYKRHHYTWVPEKLPRSLPLMAHRKRWHSPLVDSTCNGLQRNVVRDTYEKHISLLMSNLTFWQMLARCSKVQSLIRKCQVQFLLLVSYPSLITLLHGMLPDQLKNLNSDLNPHHLFRRSGQKRGRKAESCHDLKMKMVLCKHLHMCHWNALSTKYSFQK